MIKTIINKYKDIIPYAFFGVCTTLVNVFSYYVFAHLFRFGTVVSSIIAWFLAVLFAYLTNRKYVFHSKNTSREDIKNEFISFYICRLGTGVLDWLLMYILVDLCGLNDIAIKILTNILVILLNYLFSKFIIFDNNNKIKEIMNDKEKSKTILKEFGIIVLFSVASFIFLLSSPLHIWVNGYSGLDSSIFKTIGYYMHDGLMPYRDFFDHKGPLLYILNYIGTSIAYYKGIWVIEVISLFITLCFLYKIARLKCGRVLSVISAFTAISLLFSFFDGGNLCEEYAMPLIAIGLYIFLDYLLNNKINKCRLIICGMCLGGVLLLRPNMIALWIVFPIAIIITRIKDKNYKELIKLILYFLLGTLIVVVPIIMWLYLKGALSDFWFDYIIFNSQYSEAELIDISYSFIYFLNKYVLFIAIIVCIYKLYNDKDRLYLIFIIYIFLNLLLLSMSGKTFDHYGMVLIPTVPFLIATSFEICNNDKSKLPILIVAAFLMVFIIIPKWMNIFPTVYNPNEDEIPIDYTQENIVKVTKIVKENSEKNDKISVYGNWNIIYILTKRMPATNYSYQFPIGEVSQKIQKDYFKQLNEELPKMIVIDKTHYDEDIQDYLQKNNYTLLYQSSNNIDNAYFVYINNK